MSEVKPFTVNVPAEVLDDLRRRLANTRWPDQIVGSGWDYGTDIDYLRSLVDYWQNSFDWRDVERKINEFPQYTTLIDGQNIHFLHARSRVPGARPLILLHGWPGSPLEFLKLIGPLTDPVAHGGRSEDAFHVIVPSLPGFAFSGPTADRGWHEGRIADALSRLMETIGYSSFFVHGGDYGSLVASQLASRHPDQVRALHLTLIVVGGLPADDGDPTPEERALAAELTNHVQRETGYIALQATKPQTVAYSLVDSPVGLAAWIVEKLKAWTDNGGDLESVVSRDEMLANITTYWVTATGGSSVRLYFETAAAGMMGVPPTRNDIPVSVAVFPRELYRTSRRIAEYHYNVVRWTQHPVGGHFAALEQPDLLILDLRASFADQGDAARS